MVAYNAASIEGRLTTDDGVCVLTYEPLDVNKIISSVADDAAGATAVFIGTTRNSFKGRVVTRLEYEAYTKLALKTMANILGAARKSAAQPSHNPTGTVPGLLHTAVHHRLGMVPVGDPSIVIAVSSPHRREAFVACELILEEIKAKAQIWKREYYEGEDEDTAEWKANR
ncbi:molybdenum cofactor synthesis 2 [Amylostereum chailletii]|nr:molybdenum cofactor synthesis 2 [Amylostereum chailletii]